MKRGFLSLLTAFTVYIFCFRAIVLYSDSHIFHPFLEVGVLID